MKRSVRRAGFLLLRLVAAGVLSGCHRADAPSPKARYVDAGICGACHSDVYRTYRNTAMARSFSRPTPENTGADFEGKNVFYHRPSDSYFSMSRRGGRYFQRRHQIGFEGRETNAVEKEVHFAIGSGRHARTYVYESTGGKWFELPLAWYGENGGYWAMNPGYDRPDHQDFRRRITFECIFCHTGYPDVEAVADSSGGDPIFSGRIPEGIDCQRCHGPGSDHIAAVRAQPAAPENQESENRSRSRARQRSRKRCRERGRARERGRLLSCQNSSQESKNLQLSSTAQRSKKSHREDTKTRRFTRARMRCILASSRLRGDDRMWFSWG